MPLTIVLAVGLDLSLLSTRSLVLESAGYMVVPTSSVKEAVDRFQASDFDLVVLCHSIPANDRERLTHLIRASGSLSPVVSIAKATGQQDAFSTATLDENDANEFLANLKEILSKAARSATIGTAGFSDKRQLAAAQALKAAMVHKVAMAKSIATRHPAVQRGRGGTTRVKSTVNNGVHRPQVVIVGGGFAGVQAAKRLGNMQADVVLLDRNSYQVFQPLLYQTAMSVLSPADIARPIRTILRRFKNVEVLMAEVTEIDRGGRRVVLQDGDAIYYDYLILATGSTSSYFGDDEWAKHAPSLKSIEDAVEIRTRILLAFEQAERAMSQGAPQPLLHFIVIGGGPTGVELAGAIADITKNVLNKDFRHIDPAQARVSLYEGSPSVLGTFPEDLQKKAAQQLTALGVQVHTNARITDIQSDFIMVRDEKVPSTVTLWAAGVAPSSLGSKLGCPLDHRGCVIVDRFLNPEGEPRIFVCGDLAAVTENGRRIPAVAQPAMQMGMHAAKLIEADSAGKARTPFHYFDKGDMATIGVKAAVARITWPFTANWSGAPAWLTWLLVHLVFLDGGDRRFSILFTWIYSYLTKTARSQLIVATDPSPSTSRAPYPCHRQ